MSERRDDETLVACAKRADEAALVELFVRFEPLVRRRAAHFSGEGLEQEDLRQEGMLGLLSAVRNFDDGKGASFRTFAGLCIDRRMRTAVRTASRQKRAPRKAPVSLEEMPPTQEIADSREVDPENLVIEKESLETAKQLVSRHLSAFERTVLELYISGCDYREMARQLGKSRKSVDNALYRIRRKLNRQQS